MSFRMFGIPVRVEPVFFLISGLLAMSRWTEPWLLASWIGVVLVSVLFHELGHALAFRRLGYMPSIRLHGTGGHTYALSALSPRDDMTVSLAGPLFGLALGAAVYALAALFPAMHSAPFVGTLVRDLLWVNIGWSLVNLLPILPLDGGRVLIAGLRRADPRAATRRALRISMIVAALVAAVALVNGMPIAALMAGMLAFDNYRAQARG